MDAQTAPLSGLEGLVPSDARLDLLASGATWSEGPVWIPRRGVVQWSDIPAIGFSRRTA